MRLNCAFGRCQIDGARRTALLVPARAPGVTVQAIRSGVTGECTHTHVQRRVISQSLLNCGLGGRSLDSCRDQRRPL